MADKLLAGNAVSAGTDGTAESIVKAHPELFHYTDQKGFEGIFTGNSFRATHFSDLNDAHEIIELRNPFMIELAARLTPIVEELRRKSPGDPVVGRPGAPQRIASVWVTSLYTVVFPQNEASRTTLCCTTSFCSHVADQSYEHENGLLSQWRGYGKDGGFCLVFNSDEMQKLFQQEQSSFLYSYTDLLAAHYPREQAKVLDSFKELLDESVALLKIALAGNKDFVVPNAISRSFAASATAFKHQGFFEEREVRIVAFALTQLGADKMKGVQGFEPKPVKVVINDSRERRYIDLFGKTFAPLPVRRVIVGPSRKQNENAEYARKIVGSRIPVQKSATPYIG